jgi:hypothetical protein
VIGRAAALLLTLSPSQHIAADVTGDGTVSAFDASFVGRYAVELIDHFGVASATGSDWAYLRCDAYAYPGDNGCGAPVHAFTPLAQNENGRDFYAILYGDVTGNWAPSAALVASAASPEERAAMAGDRLLAPRARSASTQPVLSAVTPGSLTLQGWTGPLRKGERRELTLALESADWIYGLDLRLLYDAARLTIVSVTAPASRPATR